MAEQAVMTRERAMAWVGGLFALTVLGTGFVCWRWYLGQCLGRIVVSYAALFVCAAVMGMRAKPDEIRHGLGRGLLTLIQPAPFWALGVVVILLSLPILCGWSLVNAWPWMWRAPLPLAAGVVAGYKWARQQPAAGKPSSSEKEAPPPMDLWKP